MKQITSAQNPYIKSLVQLQEKAKTRKQTGSFLIEGKREIELAIKGGYILKGKEFIADGGDYAEASIILKRNGTPIIIANANRFSISDNKISSKLAAVKIFFDADSIYHSALKFTYINSKRKLELYRKRNSVSESPLINTYHQITMDCELLEWNIDEDMIFFGSLPGTSISEIYIESANNYLEAKYQQLQGMDKIHPLILIRNYVPWLTCGIT